MKHRSNCSAMMLYPPPGLGAWPLCRSAVVQLDTPGRAVFRTNHWGSGRNAQRALVPQTSSSTSESCPVTFLWVPLLVSSLVLGVGGAATAPHATFPTAPHPVPEELLGFAGFSLRKTSCLLVFFCQLAFDNCLYLRVFVFLHKYSGE